MSGFGAAQRRALCEPLDGDRVLTKAVDGKKLEYIEGWFAIAEANAIFGFDGWDRELVHFERISDRSRGGEPAHNYIARVRITVRAGKNLVVREGSGWGSAIGAGGHERALKAAETDATKRALATFGNRFGLCLYDRRKVGVLRKSQPSPAPGDTTNSFALIAPDGALLSSSLSPEGYCTGLTQLIAGCRTEDELISLATHNGDMLERLREQAPTLLNARGEHYADFMKRLFDRRRVLMMRSPQAAKTFEGLVINPAFHAPALLTNPSKIGFGPAIDKSALANGVTRRVRDKAHLRFVASRPCLICQAAPCHAHHLRFAQRRGLSVKVSDEFTVPLCALHHNELHRGEERSWWRQKGVDPIPIARALWDEHAEASGLGGASVTFTVDQKD